MAIVESHNQLIPYRGPEDRTLQPLPDSQANSTQFNSLNPNSAEKGAPGHGTYRYYVERDEEKPVYNMNHRMVFNEYLMKGRWVDIYV